MSQASTWPADWPVDTLTCSVWVKIYTQWFGISSDGPYLDTYYELWWIMMVNHISVEWNDNTITTTAANTVFVIIFICCIYIYIYICIYKFYQSTQCMAVKGYQMEGWWTRHNKIINTSLLCISRLSHSVYFIYCLSNNTNILPFATDPFWPSDVCVPLSSDT